LRIAVHTGTAYVGMVGSADTFAQFTALGDSVNVAARLAARAGQGEIVISEAAFRAAGLELPGTERCDMELRGHAEPVAVRIWRATAATP